MSARPDDDVRVEVDVTPWWWAPGEEEEDGRWVAAMARLLRCNSVNEVRATADQLVVYLVLEPGSTLDAIRETLRPLVEGGGASTAEVS